MKVLTCTSYTDHWDLYTEIHGSIVFNSWQIELAQKDIILLSSVSIIVYKASKHTGAENNKFIHFNLSAGAYSIDDFNGKIKVPILQKRQDWEPLQIKDLKLVITEDCTFMASNTIFIALGITNNYIWKDYAGKTYPLSHEKHPMMHHLLQNHCQCTVNKSTKLKTS